MEEAAPTTTPPAGGGVRLRPPTPRVAVLIGGLVVLGVAVFAAGSAIRPFVVGLLLAYLLDPLVERLARRGLRRWLAVLIVYALVIGLLAIALAVALPPLVGQVASFADEAPAILRQIQYQVNHLNELYDQLGLPAAFRGLADQLVTQMVNATKDLNVGVIEPVVASVTSFVGSLFGYLILPAWLFFILKDRPRLRIAADRSLPPEWRRDGWAIAGIVNEVFGRWVRGQLVLGGVVGLASFIGLTALGIWVDPIFGRFAVLLAIIAGIGELIPIIGPIISAVPAVLLGLTAGAGPALAALLLYLVIQQVENNVLVPKIQSDAIDLHPSIVIAALVIGGATFGLLGAILALPVTAAGRDVFKYAFRRAGEAGGVAPSTDAGSSDAEIRSMMEAGARFATETGAEAVQ